MCCVWLCKHVICIYSFSLVNAVVLLYTHYLYNTLYTYIYMLIIYTTHYIYIYVYLINTDNTDAAKPVHTNFQDKPVITVNRYDTPLNKVK